MSRQIVRGALVMASRNATLLAYLNDHDGKFDIAELSKTLSLPMHELVPMLWSLQKLGVVKFKEQHTASGTHLYDIQYRKTAAKKLGSAQMLFTMAADTTRPLVQEKDKLALLRRAASLLEEADEITLAILVLDAAEGKERDISLYAPTNRPLSAYITDEFGHKIRRLTADEINHLDWG